MDLGIFESSSLVLDTQPVERKAPEKVYPSLYVNGLDKPLNVDTTGKATVLYRVVSQEHRMKPGEKERYCYSIDILDFTSAKETRKKTDEEVLDELRSEISKK